MVAFVVVRVVVFVVDMYIYLVLRGNISSKWVLFMLVLLLKRSAAIPYFEYNFIDYLHV